MKSALLPLLALLCMNCFHESPVQQSTNALEVMGLRNVSLQLEQDFGEVSIAVPADLDTSYTWIQYTSDIRCDDFRVHSITKRDFPQYKFVHKQYSPDSLYEFNISYNAYPEGCFAQSGENLNVQLQEMLLALKKNASLNGYEWDEAVIEDINSWRYIFLKREFTRDQKEFLSLKALTIRKGKVISFNYWYCNKYSSKVIDKCSASLRTIKWSN